jgi:hypothetical protein
VGLAQVLVGLVTYLIAQLREWVGPVETAHNQNTYLYSTGSNGTFRYNDNITLNYDFAKGGTTRQEQA